MCTIDPAQLACEKGAPFKMVHINARSLFHKIEDIFTTFHFCEVLVITETWLNCSIPTASISVDGFSIIRQDRYENSAKKCGGICIYVKDRQQPIWPILVRSQYIKYCYLPLNGYHI